MEWNVGQPFGMEEWVFVLVPIPGRRGGLTINIDGI